jgi:hypothetical protein
MTPRTDTVRSVPQAGSLAEAVAQCARNADLLRELRRIYAAADARVAQRGAVCLGGGACCRFDLCSHRLYVSTAELALLATQAPLRPERSAMKRCAYQLGPRCTARDRRPLGCRTFFCRPPAAEDAGEEYERDHREIRLLHERFNVRYVYVELTTALGELFGEGADREMR